MVGNRWTQKPPFGTQLDRGHPLVDDAGMMGFYAQNEGTGALINDATGNLNLAATGFGATNPWGSESQLGLSATPSGSAVSSLLPTKLQLSWPITIAIAFRYTGTPNSTDMLFGASANNSFSSPFLAFGLYIASASNMFARWSAGATLPAAGPFTVSQNVDYVMSATWNGSNFYWYINGLLNFTSSMNSGAPTYSGTSSLGSGCILGAAVVPNLFSYWSSWWNTALPASVHAQIGSNVNAIWQVMQPRRGLKYFYSVPSYQPWIYGDQIQEMYG